MEIIIGIIVIFLVYHFFKAKARLRSSEFGKEAEYIAINELNVPKTYFTYAVNNDIEEIKAGAVEVKKRSSFYNNMSWSRLLAWMIYGGYRNDCIAAFNNDVQTLTKLRRLEIDINTIYETANSKHKAYQFVDDIIDKK